MAQIVVRLALLVIVASMLPVTRARAQGQNVITSRVTDASSVFFPCASGVVEKQDQTRVQKTRVKAAMKTGDRKRSRKVERRL